MCHSSEYEHLQPEPTAASLDADVDRLRARYLASVGAAGREAALAVIARHEPSYADDLFPRGRPLCTTCRTRPVYLAGECGPCWAERP